MSFPPARAARDAAVAAVAAPRLDPATDAALDNVAWASLTGPHARHATGTGAARRYLADVSPFAAVRDPGDPEDVEAWTDLARLVTPDETVLVTGAQVRPGPGWRPVLSLPGVQLVGTEELRGEPDPEARRLSVDDAADVAAMLDLVRRTEPGPLLPRTAALGTYLGRSSPAGALVSLAGERMRVPGATELSAVCTDPAWNGRGLATSLVRALVAGVRARGEVPFLHTTAVNERAIGLYEHLGFRLRRHVDFVLLQPVSAIAGALP